MEARALAAGKSAQIVTRKMNAGDFLRQNTVEIATASRDLKGQVQIEVQEKNWETVKVYGHCSWEKEALVGAREVRFVYHGITAQEVRAACSLLRIHRDRWPLITSGIVQIMVPAAKPLLNKG